MARHWLLNSATVLYGAAALVSIAVLVPVVICLTLLTLVIASPLILAFGPILLATFLIFAAFIMAVGAGLALWWLVPSFKKKVLSGLQFVLWLVSEAWKSMKESFALCEVFGAICRIISRDGWTTKGFPRFSWVSSVVEPNFGGVRKVLSLFTEAGRKLGGSTGGITEGLVGAWPPKTISNYLFRFPQRPSHVQPQLHRGWLPLQTARF